MTQKKMVKIVKAVAEDIVGQTDYMTNFDI